MGVRRIAVPALALFRSLRALYGPQHWWPLLNPTTGACEYKARKRLNSNQRFEIAVGAILTQNTNWDPNVIRALRQLWDHSDGKGISPQLMLTASESDLQSWVRPAGYFRQKSGYLVALAQWWSNKPRHVQRDDVLAIKGVGEETADSIMLYALGQPEFVMDTYTRRVMTGLGLCAGDEPYGELKAWFENQLDADVDVFKEYHALLVEHAKRHYSKKPYGVDDPLVGEF